MSCRPGQQLWCERGSCASRVCVHAAAVLTRLVCDLAMCSHANTHSPAHRNSCCRWTLPSSSSCRLSAAASCRVFSLQEPSFICTFRKGLGFRGLGHCGTSAEPGTLTQGGDPVFPWESNQKLQGGCCKPNQSSTGIWSPPREGNLGVSVFITCAVPTTKLFTWGEGDSGGHVLRETVSRGLCGLVCPSHTSEHGGEGDCVKEGGPAR